LFYIIHEKVAEVKEVTVENGTFCAGTLLGFVAAGIIGLILDRIREARGRARAQDRPLDTFPDAMQPNLTPVGVVRASQQAQFTLIAWILILIIFVGLVLVGVYYFTVPG
jgi:high-affinity Fe2+/Pb2+ permease